MVVNVRVCLCVVDVVDVVEEKLGTGMTWFGSVLMAGALLLLETG